jgi:hypothetical protein
LDRRAAGQEAQGRRRKGIVIGVTKQRSSPSAGGTGAREVKPENISDDLPNKSPDGSPRLLPDQVIAILAQRFPAAITVKGRRRPLKVGIFNDIIAAVGGDVAEVAIAAALKKYVGSVAYLRRVRAGKPRFGLDGNPAGTVTKQEEEFAKVQVSVRVDDAYRRRDTSINPRLRPKPIDPDSDPDGKWARKPHPANADKRRLSLKSWRRS